MKDMEFIKWLPVLFGVCFVLFNLGYALVLIVQQIAQLF